MFSCWFGFYEVELLKEELLSRECRSVRTGFPIRLRGLSPVWLLENLRTQEDLINQLFNSSEKRLARALLLLARYGKPNQVLTLPKVSQNVLAEMIGTTRTRVNYFMNKFRKLGFIEYDGVLKINKSLLSVVLQE